jgi:hypothetical protein
VDLDTIQYGKITASKVLRTFKNGDKANEYALAKARKMGLICHVWGSDRNINITGR